MNVPKLRFGEFAGDWEISTFDDIALKQSRKYNPETEKKDLTCIELEHIEQGTGSLLGSVSAKEQKSIKNRFSQGNVLFGKLRPYLRKYAQPNFDGVCSSEIWVFSGKTVNNDFLYRLIQTDYFMSAVSSTSGSKMPRAEWDLLKNLNFGYPKNTNEQQKIADFLSAVDEKITALAAQKTALTQYKQGMMQRIFSQTLRFKDDNGADYPDWEECLGGDVFSNISNKNHNSDLPILAITQEHGAIPRDMIEYNITVTDKSVESYKVVEVGDYIISLRSFQGGIEYSSFKGICSPAYIILRPSIDVDRSFFKHFFKTPNYIQLLNQKLEGIRDGKMISYKYFSETPLPLPCKAEQTKIAQLLTECDDKINAVDTQIQSAQQWKQGLLQQMFV